MIDAALIRLVALADASSDWWGCYELMADLEGHYPATSESDRQRAAQEAILQLLADGLIEIACSGSWPPEEYQTLSSSKARDVIRDSASWLHPSDTPAGSSYWLGATNAGLQAYHTISPEEVTLLNRWYGVGDAQRRFAADGGASIVEETCWPPRLKPGVRRTR